MSLPKDLFHWNSWHFTRARKHCVVVEDVLKAILKRNHPSGIRRLLESSTDIDQTLPIMIDFRIAFDLPPFEVDQPWIAPDANWVSNMFREFIKFALDQIPVEDPVEHVVPVEPLEKILVEDPVIPVDPVEHVGPVNHYQVVTKRNQKRKNE